jgi:hypothetical protein
MKKAKVTLPKPVGTLPKPVELIPTEDGYHIESIPLPRAGNYREVCRALRAKGWEDSTPLHYAASTGLLTQIPKDLLTEEGLLTPNRRNCTPLGMTSTKEGLEWLNQNVKISTQSLKKLLSCEMTSKAAGQWVKKEILERNKTEVRKALKNCEHPAL